MRSTILGIAIATWFAAGGAADAAGVAINLGPVCTLKTKKLGQELPLETVTGLEVGNVSFAADVTVSIPRLGMARVVLTFGKLRLELVARRELVPLFAVKALRIDAVAHVRPRGAVRLGDADPGPPPRLNVAPDANVNYERADGAPLLASVPCAAVQLFGNDFEAAEAAPAGARWVSAKTDATPIAAAPKGPIVGTVKGQQVGRLLGTKAGFDHVLFRSGMVDLDGWVDATTVTRAEPELTATPGQGTAYGESAGWSTCSEELPVSVMRWATAGAPELVGTLGKGGELLERHRAGAWVAVHVHGAENLRPNDDIQLVVPLAIFDKSCHKL